MSRSHYFPDLIKNFSRTKKNTEYFDQFKKKYDVLIRALISEKLKNISCIEIKKKKYQEHGLKAILATIKRKIKSI